MDGGSIAFIIFMTFILFFCIAGYLSDVEINIFHYFRIRFFRKTVYHHLDKKHPGWKLDLLSMLYDKKININNYPFLLMLCLDDDKFHKKAHTDFQLLRINDVVSAMGVGLEFDYDGELAHKINSAAKKLYDALWESH